MRIGKLIFARQCFLGTPFISSGAAFCRRSRRAGQTGHDHVVDDVARNPVIGDAGIRIKIPLPVP